MPGGDAGCCHDVHKAAGDVGCFCIVFWIDRTLFLEGSAAEIESFPATSLTRRGNAVSLFLNDGTLFNSGIICPVSIYPHPARAKVCQNGKGFQAGHGKEIHPDPEIRITASNRFEDGQECLNSKIMIDQETPVQAGINDVVDIGRGLRVIQNMNYGQDDWSRTFEFLMKISSLQHIKPGWINCVCDTKISAALCKISTTLKASDLLKCRVGLYRTVKLIMLNCKQRPYKARHF